MNPSIAPRFRALLQAEMLPVVLGAAAFLVGVAGEVLLFKDRWRTVGAIVLGLSALMGALAWRGVRDKLVADTTQTAWGTRRETALRLAGIAGSILFFLGGLLAWQDDPGAVFGLQGLFWVGSVALLVASCWRWGEAAARTGVEAGDASRAHEIPWTRIEVALFVGIVVLSLVTHLAFLNDVPWRFTADEDTAYAEAMRFYQGPAISIFTTTWYGTGMPSMPLAVSGWLLNIAGTSLGGVRASTALFGALTVVPLYGLGRLWQGRTFAALAAFSMAVSAVDIHYSRVSLPNMLTPFFWTVCFYFLVKGLRSSRPADFMLAGLFAGFSMYTYYATRLLPYLLIAFLVYLALFHFPVVRARIRHFGLVLVGFFVGFGPLLAYFITNPDMWAGRGITELVIPAAIPTSWQALVDDVTMLAPLVWRNFLGLSVTSSNDHIYWASFLLPVEAVLAVIGAGVLVWRWRQPGSFLVLLWGGTTLFISGPLIAESVQPAYVHWAAAFPVFYLAIALPSALWLRSMREGLKSSQGTLRMETVGRVIVVVGALAIGVANVYFYFVAYPKTVPPAFESAQARLLTTLNAHDRVYFVGNSQIGYIPASRDMLAQDVSVRELLNPSLELPLQADPDHDLVFVFNNDETRYLPVIEGVYPGGEAGEIATPGGPIGMTYTVAAAQAVSRSGALWPTSAGSGLSVSWQGSVAGSRVDPFVGSSMLSDDPGAVFAPYLRAGHERDPNFVPLVPVGARGITWEGEVETEGGVYTMSLRTDGRAQLTLDAQTVIDLSSNVGVTVPDFFQGRFLDKSAQVNLSAGWHKVKLSLEPTGNLNDMEWSWTRPDGVQEIVPPWVLRHD